MKLIKQNYYEKLNLILIYIPIIFLYLIINIACQAPTKKPPKKMPELPVYSYEFPIKIKKPIIRIGLQTDAELIQLSCTGKFQVILQDKKEIIKEQPNAIVYFAPKISKYLKTTSYAIQLGTFSIKENAVRLVNEIKEKFNISSNLIIEETNYKYKVKLIAIKDKEEAEKLKRNFIEKNYEAWIISDYITSAESKKENEFAILFYDDSDEKRSESSNKITILAEREEDRIIFNKRPYRGGFIIFLNDRGKLNVINVLNIEDYLKGVVPLEMGSYTYSAIEALKAQAVAARTYAIRNLGQYEKEGYDICATPACQVYGGSSVEETLANKAIDDTAGEIITYQGNPIIALYTSTCGGHTEDGNNIFNLNEPYLKGVICSYENQNVYSITSNNELYQIQDEDGYNITSNIYFLHKLGFLEKEYIASLKENITKNEWENWIKKLMIYLDLNPDYKAELLPDNLLQAIVEIAKAIKADEKARLLFPSQVNETLMNFSDIYTGDIDIKKIIALFISLKYLRPYSDNTLKLYDPPYKYRVLDIIYRILEYHHIFIKQTATVIEIKDDNIKLKMGPNIQTFTISKDILLAHSYGNLLTMSKEIKLAAGDVINYWSEKNEIYYIEANWGMQGESSDRSSKYAFWNQFISIEELTEKINKIKGIGIPTDIIIVRQGVSGRVVELLIKGEKGEITLKGLNIRMTLGLKENWFTVDKVVGRQKGYLFTGRGWGHGVGLCQVGAYGMAIQGRNYREIIKHYYTGVDIVKKGDNSK